MNGQQLAPICAGFAVAVVLFLVFGYFLRKRDMTAHLAPVKRELKKEKAMAAARGSIMRLW